MRRQDRSVIAETKYAFGIYGAQMLFQWPIDPAYRWISGYDYDPPPNGSHGAQDFGTIIGADYRAPQNGVVKRIRKGIANGKGEGYGNFIEIDHGDGWITLGAHLSEVYVEVGDVVVVGQLIGKTGNTGNSSGPHLHFVIKRNGTPLKPTDYLVDNVAPLPGPPVEDLPEKIRGRKATTTQLIEGTVLNVRSRPGGVDIGDIKYGDIVEVFDYVVDVNNIWFVVSVSGVKYDLWGYSAAFWFGKRFLVLLPEEQDAV